LKYLFFLSLVLIIIFYAKTPFFVALALLFVQVDEPLEELLAKRFVARTFGA